MGPVGTTPAVRVLNKPKKNNPRTAPQFEETYRQPKIDSLEQNTTQRSGNLVDARRWPKPDPLQMDAQVETEGNNRKEVDERQDDSVEERFEQVRDLYNRKAKVAYWINRAKSELKGTDRKDVLTFVEDLQARERASLWVVRCITALMQMRKQLGKKTFRKATKKDIAKLLQWMKDENYKPSTQEKFRQVLKLFYKTVFGKGKVYPKKVEWFPTRLSKEKRLGQALDLNKYLETEEVKRLIDTASTVQRKAFLACLYETGARPEEFLRLTNMDMKVELDGVAVILRGKTGERRIMIVTYAPMLHQWLAVHPLKNQARYSLWVSESSNYKNKPIGLRGAEKLMAQTMKAASLGHKRKALYILRHSRATYMAQYLTEAKLCQMFGWQIGSSVPRGYVHMSGRDLDNILVSIGKSGEPKPREHEFKTMACNRCAETMSPGMTFCSKCGLPANLMEQYAMDKQKEVQEKEKDAKLHELSKEVTGLRTDLQVLVSAMGSMSQQARNELAKQLYQAGLYRPG